MKQSLFFVPALLSCTPARRHVILMERTDGVILSESEESFIPQKNFAHIQSNENATRIWIFLQKMLVDGSFPACPDCPACSRQAAVI